AQDGLAIGLGYLAAALVTGMAAIGAGIAVAAAAPAAIGAFSEDPKSFGKSLIFVALGEGVAIYGLLISILILNKL
ncbi:ATP synthase subunit C, partial [Intestinibacillus massiliensis]|uniref:ATP synthase subunit C n=1 Tax=Intestinibacillus massiliensis TaxID=1871029 RepID=UPI001F2B76D9